MKQSAVRRPAIDNIAWMYFTLRMQNNQPPIVTTELNKKSSGPWGFWSTVGFGLLVILAYFVGQVLVENIFAVNNSISHPGESISQLTNILSSGNALATTIFVSTVIGMGLTILFIRMHKGIPIKEYLALRSIKFTTFISVLGIAIVLLFLSGLFLSGLGQTKFTEDLTQAYKNSSVLVLLAAVIFAPVFEEIFFRGFLFAGFRTSKIGVIGAVLLTAALWSLLHATQYNSWELVVIFGLGVAFGIVRWKTNSLYASLAMHSLWNLISITVATLLVQGKIYW